MGRKRPTGREGKVICRCSGGRWSAELRLDDPEGTQGRQHRLVLARAFASEAAARGAGEEILAEWTARQLALRDLVLRELAAAYRALREAHDMAEPAAVPTTSAAWERAIAAWQARKWIGPADVKRYRQHVRSAFDATAAPVKRLPMLTETDSDIAV